MVRVVFFVEDDDDDGASGGEGKESREHLVDKQKINTTP